LLLAVLVVVVTAVIGSAALLTVDGGTIQAFVIRVTVPVPEASGNPNPIPATVDIKPDALDKTSQGRPVTCYIELPEHYNVNDINVPTIELRVRGADGVNAVSAQSSPTGMGDHDGDGIPDLMVKFSRSKLVEALGGQSGRVTLLVAGKLTDGSPFEGTDAIRVISSSSTG